MKKEKILYLLFAVVLVGVIFLSFQGKEKKEEVIKIGVIAPLSGDLSVWGESVKNGIELAVDEINSLGGIEGKKVKIIYEDSKNAQISEGISALNKLIHLDNVLAVIGPVDSGVMLSLAPIANENEIVLLTPTATSPKITDAGEYIFRNSISSHYLGRELANFVFHDLNILKTATVYVNNDYGLGFFNSFSSKFKDLGGENIFFEYNYSESDFRTILLKIKEFDPEGLIVISFGSEGGLIARQSKELSIDAQIIGGDNFGEHESVITGGDSIEDSIFVTTFVNEDSAEMKKFITDYNSKFGEEPSILWVSANAYDSANILIKAIQEAGESREEIRNFLNRLENYNGLGGIIHFNEKGDVVRDKAVVFKIIKEGNPLLIK